MHMVYRSMRDTTGSAVAYPELVSREVSKSRKCKWLVKVGCQ